MECVMSDFVQALIECFMTLVDKSLRVTRGSGYLDWKMLTSTGPFVSIRWVCLKMGPPKLWWLINVDHHFPIFSLLNCSWLGVSPWTVTHMWQPSNFQLPWWILVRHYIRMIMFTRIRGPADWTKHGRVENVDVLRHLQKLNYWPCRNMCKCHCFLKVS